jgi:hypothetical protein
MKILVTDVTEMRNEYCVAGWSYDNKGMVRPLPNGSNWGADQVAALRVTPGAAIEFRAVGWPLSPYPHRTEDTLIDPNTISCTNNGPIAWFGRDAPPTAATLNEAFEGNLRNNACRDHCLRGVYVPAGTQTRSLYAVGVARHNLIFFEENKLRVQLYDGSQCYDLAVTGRALKELYRARGIDGVSASLPDTGPLHVRVGLARAWDDEPNKCYVMINGIYW